MFKKLLLFGLVVVLALYIGLTFFLGSIVKSGVNNFGPKLTQTKVELAEANISPLTGAGSLRGLAVGNPSGWSAGNAFYLGKVSVDLEPFSIFGDHVVINEIIIDQPEFLYETKFISSNIKDLLKNIEKFSGGGGKAATTKTGQPIKLVVKKFRLTNGKATLGVGGNSLPVTLPTIAMDDLGVKEGGLTPDQLAGAMMNQVLGQIAVASAQALAKDGGAGATKSATDAAKKAGDSIKKLFGGKP